MKKLTLFLILLTLGVSIRAQVQHVTPVTVKDSVALVADTTNINTASYDYDYGWILSVETFDVDAADAVVTVQVCNDTTKTNSWITYDVNSILTLTDTSGMHSFRGSRLINEYMRVITAPVSVTSGEYRVILSKVRNR